MIYNPYSMHPCHIHSNISLIPRSVQNPKRNWIRPLQEHQNTPKFHENHYFSSSEIMYCYNMRIQFKSFDSNQKYIQMQLNMVNKQFMKTTTLELTLQCIHNNCWFSYLKLLYKIIPIVKHITHNTYTYYTFVTFIQT